MPYLGRACRSFISKSLILEYTNSKHENSTERRMADEKISLLSLQLLLDDLDQLEDQQKGKQVAGKHTDLEVAIQLMKEDISIAQTSFQDAILALSTNTAVATDQNVLASIREDETLAEQDHRYALALSNGEIDGYEKSVSPESKLLDHNEDTVSVVMSDLMSRIAISEDARIGEGSSRSSHPTQTPNRTKKCVSCLEEFHDSMFASSCRHEFCLGCVRQMFLGAIKDEELYPPRCCGEVIPPGIALRVLQYRELSAFSERAIEWTAKDRLYCAEATCSKFIPPFAIKNEIGICPSCGQSTHLTCRSFAHPGVDCPMDNALHDILQIAEDENWKRCFHCRTMVELQHGCNHITCRCGREFCYICGRVWKTCDCPLWHEERLTNMANQAIDEELPPDANAGQRQNAFDQMVEGLRRHEE
ncbi:hypothetical protein N7512_002859, partial [Penicillium capsulatum]